MSPPRPVHYGWVIVLAGALTLFSCFGLARFAFGMLLPAMRAGLQLSYDDMGFLSTGNFAGYLVAVALAPLALRYIAPRKLVTGALLVIGLCLLAISQSSAYWLLGALYTVIGMGGGFANIPIMALVSRWFRRERRGQAAGMMIMGNGTAIILTGFLVPWLNATFGGEGWRAGWLLLGAACLVLGAVVWVLLRDDPAELGLEPLGAAPVAVRYDPAETRGDYGAARILLHLGGIYLLFGLTYMVYGTFIVATMVDEYHLAETTAGNFWSWTGFFCLFSGVGFGVLSDRLGRRGGLLLAFSVQGAAYLLVASRLGDFALFGSVALYGLAVFAVPAIMAAAVGDYLGTARAAAAFSIITFGFAIGQTIGPGAAGVMAEAAGTFRVPYLAAAALNGVALLAAGFLPRPPRDAE
jgi:MFS family permease